MASIREKKQTNKTLSYHFTCCPGRDARGKQLRRCSTWIPAGEMTPGRARKTAEKAADAWERQMRAEFEKDLSSPKRAKTKELARIILIWIIIWAWN